MRVKSTAPTMKDVAQEAGVALGTVSKVFNNLRVGQSYRQRVEQAAERLGYQVNVYARGLRAGRTGTVSLILPRLTDPFFSALAENVAAALVRRDCRMLLAVTDSDPEMKQRCIRMVEQNKVDGIIGLTYKPGLEVGDTIPYVSIDRYVNPRVPCVASDNFGGGQMAAQKLIDLGCRQLLFFRIGSEVAGEADKRGSGFQSICQYRNVGHAVLNLNDEEGYSPFFAYLKEHIANGRPQFDGIFCNTDRLAYHVLRMLAELGVRVPQDVQVIGFDGVRQFGDEALYCSTIVQPVAQIAETCVGTLLDQEHDAVPSLICLPVSYRAGGTTRE